MRHAVIVLALFLSLPAWADSMELALSLGSVLASEKFCGLNYDAAAIQIYIEKNVKADDMGFPSMLNMMTKGQEVQNRDLSLSQKAAHCAQIGRIAKSYGFAR